MTEFVPWLEELSEKDTNVRAVLRRSLAYELGEYAPAFPYVEPFAGDVDDPWRRKMLYLVAGLWAAYSCGELGGEPLSLGMACATLQPTGLRSSTERRFITLLNADSDHFPHRLRQLVALLKQAPLDYENLLNGLLCWNHGSKRTQNSWVRDFYRYRSRNAGSGNIVA